MPERELTRRLSSWPLWVLLGVAAGVALAVGSHVGAGPASVGQRVSAIASDIRCPSCSGLSAEDSNSSTAVAIRDAIRRRVAAGQSDAQIEGYLESRYGSGIVMQPPVSGVDALVWVLPIAAAGVACAVVLAMFWQRRRRRRTGVTGEDRELVERALADRSGEGERPRRDGPSDRRAVTAKGRG